MFPETRLYIALPPQSTIMIELPVDIALTGKKKLAVAAAPDVTAQLCEDEPAKVVTVPPGVIMRTCALARSATMTLPSLSNDTPQGLLKAAAAPTPLEWAAEPEPASVETSPPNEIERILLLYLSPTTTPTAETAMPEGPLKLAKFPAPSANAAVPLPASVDVFQ